MTGPSLCVLGVLAQVNSRLIREEFAQGAEIFKHSSTEFAEFGEFLIKTLYSASSAPWRCNLRAVLHRKPGYPQSFLPSSGMPYRAHSFSPLAIAALAGKQIGGKFLAS